MLSLDPIRSESSHKTEKSTGPKKVERNSKAVQTGGECGEKEDKTILILKNKLSKTKAILISTESKL